MVNLLILFRFYISRSTALAEASTGISSVCDILDIGYMSPSCSCRCSDPSQPQTVEILVNSAKHRHICLPGLREMKRCTFGKRFTVNSCQERPPSFTFCILSIHQFMLLARCPLLQYLSTVQVLGNIQNYWSFFENTVLYLLERFAQNAVLQDPFVTFRCVLPLDDLEREIPVQVCNRVLQ